MNTTTTTTFEHDATGNLVRQTVTTEEIPAGGFLRTDGLSDDQVNTLVVFRDAMLAQADRQYPQATAEALAFTARTR